MVVVSFAFVGFLVFFFLPAWFLAEDWLCCCCGEGLTEKRRDRWLVSSDQRLIAGDKPLLHPRTQLVKAQVVVARPNSDLMGRKRVKKQVQTEFQKNERILRSQKVKIASDEKAFWNWIDSCRMAFGRSWSRWRLATLMDWYTECTANNTVQQLSHLPWYIVQGLADSDLFWGTWPKKSQVVLSWASCRCGSCWRYHDRGRKWMHTWYLFVGCSSMAHLETTFLCQVASQGQSKAVAKNILWWLVVGLHTVLPWCLFVRTSYRMGDLYGWFVGHHVGCQKTWQFRQERFQRRWPSDEIDLEGGCDLHVWMGNRCQCIILEGVKIAGTA